VGVHDSPWDENETRLEQAKAHAVHARAQAAPGVVVEVDMDVEKMTLSDTEEAHEGPDDDFTSIASSSFSGGTMIPQEFSPVRAYEMDNMRNNELMASRLHPDHAIFDDANADADEDEYDDDEDK
jgi:hypothetical protein